ncbi:MAG: DUF5317 domain-containing protein [Chloroflexi bacterium]|nr:DUF5317 domain-containing protein [Chloroflexota bacterium]
MASLQPRAIWLALAAFALQFFVVKEIDSGLAARLVLGLSHILLLAVVFLNRRQIGFLVVGLGLLLNLTAVYANGGLMPMSPAAAFSLELPGAHPGLVEGARFGAKNVLLAPEHTRFYFLSDRLPTRFPRRLLYSVGDAVILGGLGLLVATALWSVARPASGQQAGSRRRGQAPRPGALRKGAGALAFKVQESVRRQQEASFLRVWRSHWQALTDAVSAHLTAGGIEEEQTAEQAFARERSWLLSHRWRFADAWLPYSRWERVLPAGPWSPLDPRQIVLAAPDPFAALYDQACIVSALALAQVRTAQDGVLLLAAFERLDQELDRLEAHRFGKPPQKARGKPTPAARAPAEEQA